jgi:hypothetical protein
MQDQESKEIQALRKEFQVPAADQILSDKPTKEEGCTIIWCRRTLPSGEQKDYRRGKPDSTEPGEFPTRINVPKAGLAEFPKQPKGTLLKGLYVDYEKDGSERITAHVRLPGQKKLTILPGKLVG